MVSAIDCKCAELTGSGRVATAASIASIMIPIVSGGKHAFEKSFIWSALILVLSANSTRRTFPAAVAARPQFQLHWHCAVPLPIAQTLGKSAANYCPREDLVWRQTGFYRIATCRTESFESTRFIAGRYAP